MKVPVPINGLLMTQAGRDDVGLDKQRSRESRETIGTERASEEIHWWMIVVNASNEEDGPCGANNNNTTS